MNWSNSPPKEVITIRWKQFDGSYVLLYQAIPAEGNIVNFIILERKHKAPIGLKYTPQMMYILAAARTNVFPFFGYNHNKL